MQSSDTATGVRVNCWYHIFSQKWNAGNKQTKFAFLILEKTFLIFRYKLRDFMKNYDDYVNDPTKRRFLEDFVTISYRQE